MKEELTPFEQKFHMFMAAYEAIDPFDRPEKIRRLMKGIQVPDKETTSEMFDLFTNAASTPNPIPKAEKIFPSDIQCGSVCTCTSCPHKEELMRIDQFYSGFLTSCEEGNNALF